MMTSLLFAVVILATLEVTHADYFVQVNTTSCYFWSHWSSYTSQTACAVTCGTGEQKRQRTRVCYHPGYFPPPGCRFGEVEQEKATCDSGVSCDGTLSTWTEWAAGPCSQYCGLGTRVSTRSRTCTPTGRCSGDLAETRRESCLGLGGYCRFPCFGYRSFIYQFGNPTTHVCLRGSYEQINCPAQINALQSTCGRDYVRCQVYWRIERFCAYQSG